MGGVIHTIKETELLSMNEFVSLSNVVVLEDCKTESLSMKGGKPQLSTAVLEDCKTESSSMVK